MRTILTLSTLAMISAGIYGAADLAKDLHNGTMIQYEGDGTSSIASSIHSTKMNTKTDVIKKKIASIDEKKKMEPPVVELSNISYEDFSRGEVYVPEPLDVELTDSVSAPEVNTETPAPVNGSQGNSNTTNDSASTTINNEKPQLDLSMYSRAPLKKRSHKS